MELKEVENRISVEKINRSKSWFFKYSNKINKPLASLREEKRDLNRIESEGHITNLTEKNDHKRLL